MILSKHQALLEGSKLWVIPDDKNSPLNNRINWLVNFQLSKANLHTPPQLTPWIKNCVTECGIETLTLPKYDLVLIPVKNLLPAEWLCQIPVNTKMETWVESVYKIWNQMHRPKLRVFLPSGADKEDWQKFWINLEPNEELTVVLQ
jgi:hypothetical protein